MDVITYPSPSLYFTIITDSAGYAPLQPLPFLSSNHKSWWRHQMENFPRYWPFVLGIPRLPLNFPHKGQRRGALMFSLICVWTNSWVYNRDAGDLRRRRAHYDVTLMWWDCSHPMRRTDLGPRLDGTVGMITGPNECQAIAVIMRGIMVSILHPQFSAFCCVLLCHGSAQTFCASTHKNTNYHWSQINVFRFQMSNIHSFTSCSFYSNLIRVVFFTM